MTDCDTWVVSSSFCINWTKLGVATNWSVDGEEPRENKGEEPFEDGWGRSGGEVANQR